MLWNHSIQYTFSTQITMNQMWMLIHNAVLKEWIHAIQSGILGQDTVHLFWIGWWKGRHAVNLGKWFSWKQNPRVCDPFIYLKPTLQPEFLQPQNCTHNSFLFVLAQAKEREREWKCKKKDLKIEIMVRGLLFPAMPWSFSFPASFSHFNLFR